MASKSDLTFRIFGKDETASRTLKGVGRTADDVGRGMGKKFGTAFAGIGTLAVAAGATIAVDFGKASIDAFTEAQESAAKFDDAFSRMPELAKYKGQIDDLSQALALKTRFDDDATKSAAALLSKFNLTGDELVDLLPLVQDYAAFTGTDLNTAAGKVGKAFLGNAKALKELGIKYKPTGDKAKDFAAITAALNEKVGGFAEKEGQSAAGTSAILANQFGELQEQVGSWLIPALLNLSRWIIEKVIPAIQTAADWVQEHLGPAFADLGEWVTGTLMPALGDFADWFVQEAWPKIQEFAGLIADNLQPALDALGDYWNETLAPAIEKAWPTISKLLAIWGGIQAGIALVVSWIIGKIVPAFLWVAGKVAPIVVGIVETIGKIIDIAMKVRDKVAEAFGKMADRIKPIADAVLSAFRVAFNGIARLWNNTVGKLSFTAPDWIPYFGGKGWDVPDIPMLAKGGIVTRPTLAMIGEAGPEAVVPLSRGGGMGTTVVVQVTQPLGTPEAIARAVTDAFRKAGRGGAVAASF